MGKRAERTGIGGVREERGTLLRAGEGGGRIVFLDARSETRASGREIVACARRGVGCVGDGVGRSRASRGECIRHESGIEFEIVDGDARRIRKVKIRGLDEKKVKESNILLSDEEIGRASCRERV